MAITSSEPNSVISNPAILGKLELYKGRNSQQNYVFTHAEQLIVEENPTMSAKMAEVIECRLLPFVEFQNPTATFALAMLAFYRHEDFANGMVLLKLASKQGYLMATFELAILYGCSDNPSWKYKSHKLLQKLRDIDDYPLAWLQAGLCTQEKLRAAKRQLKHKYWLRSLVSARTQFTSDDYYYGTVASSIQGKCQNSRCINHVYSPCKPRDEWLKQKQHSVHWKKIVSSPTISEQPDACYIVPKGTTCNKCGYVFYCSEACRVMDWNRHKAVCGEMERVD